MPLDLDTSEKVASLIAAIIGIASLFFIKRNRRRNPEQSEKHNKNKNTNTQSVVVNVTQQETSTSVFDSESDLKSSKKILFIDDDKTFKIVTILKKMGWIHTRIVIDLPSLDATTLKDADVVFVDIQGVGKIMHYQDEGLGLALAIKRRHPNKKVVIYSAQEHGPRFHEAHQVADYSLPKTAEPIRFEEVILKVLRS